MVSITSFTQNVFVALAIATLSQGLTIPEGLTTSSSSASLVVTLGFTVSRTPFNGTAHELFFQKRADVPTILTNEGPNYAAEITIGSSNQKQTVIIDTGSSDLWVVSSSAQCQTGRFGQGPEYCKQNGTYDASASSSATNLNQAFAIEYLDGSTSLGGFYLDTVGFSGVSVRDQKFGVADTTSVNMGILGIGFASHESNGEGYDNVPVTLKKQGVIGKNAYSLYLNAEDASTGQIIFGGVDHAKYEGSLTALPVTSDNELRVQLGSIGLGGSNVGASVGVMLDSGTTYSFLEQGVADQLANVAGATWDENMKFYRLSSCDVSGDAVFSFDKGVKITVPLSELVIRNVDGQHCYFGVGRDGSNILGDNFLRRAYVVYDLDDRTISLAQVKYTDASDVSAL
ncbi:Candidapepsin [Candida viswanathii]|uniref:candidapepsin n=1 Tax=Candida viswanathii TaxID=5486 RepID=A0A367XVV2_9ASCO|nr:Candidapepsin [Candida viswanathii]